MNIKNLFIGLIVSSVITGSVMVAHSGYFYTKGLFAQFLLNNAWEKSKWSGQFVKPWNRADTWPVARLTINSIGLSRVVLKDARNTSLSFGPAHISVSARPGSNGNIAIAGHRDSFFRNLALVKRGDVIELESLNTVHYFEVSDMEIADPEDTHWVEHTDDNLITLVTCYPFDYIGPAPKRYIVRGMLMKTEGHENLRG
jgi:sortase A